ncbi:hypothetical protein EDB19DRAFT_1907673 [Suillus lakei]|nr:hypothetical protein EDB19DRAFT_1907673 [Suillus lakei]
MSTAAGPSSTTNGSRNPSANLERLNTAVLAIEELQVQVQDIKEKADKKMAVLRTGNEILKDVEELSEHVLFLATMLGVRNEEDGLDGENGGSLSEIDPTLCGTSKPVSEASSSAKKLSAMELSFAASKSKAIQVYTKDFLISIHSNFRIKKDVIINTLKIHLGADSLAGASLPAFPFGIDEERWPKNPVDQKPYMCLNWDAAYNKWPNAEALDRIFNLLRVTGAKRCPATDEDLENICDNDLKERIKDKFISMAQEFKSKHKAQANLQAKIQEFEDRHAAAEENLNEEFADESTAVVVTTASRGCASVIFCAQISASLNPNPIISIQFLSNLLLFQSLEPPEPPVDWYCFHWNQWTLYHSPLPLNTSVLCLTHLQLFGPVGHLISICSGVGNNSTVGGYNVGSLLCLLLHLQDKNV